MIASSNPSTLNKSILIAFIFFLTISISGCGGNVDLITEEFTPFEVLSEHNKIRYSKNLPVFEIDEELEQKSQSWSESMATKNRLRHGSLNHSKFSYIGENIAWGQSSVEEVLDSWMNSKGHRANILNKRYTHIGVGTARRADGRVYWCVQFGG